MTSDVSGSIDQLKNASWNPDRVQAAERLGELGDVLAVEALIECLQDDYVANAAGEALARIGDARGIKVVLQKGSSLWAAATAAKALAGLDPVAPAEYILYPI
jgi:HEAT repeat protein